MKPMLHRSFKPAKCKISLQMAASRLKVLKNKKDVHIKQLKKDLAQLLESGQDQTARIRVENFVREEKTMAAYELIGIYCEMLVARLSIIETQKKCPPDLKEAVASVMFASRRCTDVPELLDILKHFTAKYGKDFANSAIELRPDCGVSRLLVEKLSVKAPDGPAKIKILSAIAKEYDVKWEPKSFEETDSKPESMLGGPSTLEAISHFQKETPNMQARFHNETPNVEAQFHAETPDVQAPPVQHVWPNAGAGPVTTSSYHTQHRGFPSQPQSVPYVTADAHPAMPSNAPYRDMERYEHGYEQTEPSRIVSPWQKQNRNMEFPDAAAAAQAAAESADQASRAARAAAELSNLERLKRQSSTESRSSFASCASRFEAPQRYGISNPQSDSVVPYPYEDIDNIEGDNLKEKFEKDVKKSDEFELAASVRNDMLSREDKDVGSSVGVGFMEKCEQVVNRSDESSSEFPTSIGRDMPSKDFNPMSSRHSRKSSYGTISNSHSPRKSGDSDLDLQENNGGYLEEIHMGRQSSHNSTFTHSSPLSSTNPQKLDDEVDDNIFAGSDMEKSLGKNSIDCLDDVIAYDDYGNNDEILTFDSLDNNDIACDDYGNDDEILKFDSENRSEVKEDVLMLSSPVRKTPTSTQWNADDSRIPYELESSDSSQRLGSRATIEAQSPFQLCDDENGASHHVEVNFFPAKFDDSSTESDGDEESFGGRSGNLKSPRSYDHDEISYTPPSFQQSQVDKSDSNHSHLNERKKGESPNDQSRFPVVRKGENISFAMSDEEMEGSELPEDSYLGNQTVLAFGNLTGGLKNKGKKLPPHSLNPTVNMTPEIEKESSIEGEKSFKSRTRQNRSFEKVEAKATVKESVWALKQSYNTEAAEENTPELTTTRNKLEECYEKGNQSPITSDDLEEEISMQPIRNKWEKFGTQRSAERDEKCGLSPTYIVSSLDDPENDALEQKFPEGRRRLSSEFPLSDAHASNYKREDVQEKLSTFPSRPNVGMSRRTKTATKKTEQSTFQKPKFTSETALKASFLKDPSPTSLYNMESKAPLERGGHRPLYEESYKLRDPLEKVTRETKLKTGREKVSLTASFFVAEGKTALEPRDHRLLQKDDHKSGSPRKVATASTSVEKDPPPSSFYTMESKAPGEVEARRPLYEESYKPEVKEKSNDPPGKETKLKAGREKVSLMTSSYVTEAKKAHGRADRSHKSAAKEKPPRDSLQKIATASGHVESPKASRPSEERLPNKGRAPSHVHPKLPDYDDLLTKLGNLRS